MIIRNGTVLNNSNYNRTIYIGGDWINQNTSSGGFIAGRGTVVFDGNRTQKFNVRVTENFYNVTMNTTGVVDMAESANNAALAVSNRLNLSRGIILSYDNKVVHVTNTATDAVAGGNANAFVDGPLSKRIFAGQSFTFQVGNNGRYGQMAVLNTQGGASPADWTVKYVNENPYPRNEANLNTPITSVSNNEHWVVSRPAGASANIQLRWDDNSYPGVTSDASLRNRLRVVQYNNADTKWSERGQTVNASAKTVATANRVTTNDYIFTLGLSGVTATISDFTQVEICNNGSVASIPVTLTGAAPWTLSYRVTGPVTRNFTQTGITSPNYVIQLTGADLAGAGNYSVSLVSVSDNSAAGIANAGSVNLVVQQAFVPVISGAAMVGRSEVRTYSTPQNGANTYTWSWVGASGGTIATPNAASTNITFGTTNGTYQLQVTETTTATGCQVSTVFAIEVTNIPVPDINPKQPNICVGTTTTYTTAAITNNQYRWTVTGGTIQTADATNWRTVAANGNSITVLWNTAGNGSVKVEERVGATSVQGETTVSIVISPAVNGRVVSVEDAQVCDGNGTFIRIASSEPDVSYRLKNLANGSYMGPSVGGTGADLLIPTGELLHSQSPYNIAVVAFNLACELELANKPQVTVRPAPVVTLVSDATDNKFCAGTSVSFTATPAYSNYLFMVDGASAQNGINNTFSTSGLVNNSQVYVRASDSNGCIGQSNTLTLQTVSINGLWTGAVNNQWDNNSNWCSGLAPMANADIEISSKAVNNPTINSALTINNLTIQSGKSLTLAGAAKVTVNGGLINNGTLVINNNSEIDGLASLITKGTITGTGNSNIKLTLPKDRWFYITSGISSATLGNFSTGNAAATVHVHRNNQWYSTGIANVNTALLPLEGVLVKYASDPTFTVDYAGAINNGSITRNYTTNGWYLFGNPYPSFINWQDDAGWNRPNIDGTMWYRTLVGSDMVFITYNRWAAAGARVAMFPNGTWGNESDLANIPPMQAVWIKAFTPTSISVNNDARNHGVSGSQLKSSSANNADIIRIVASNNSSRDGAVVYFSNQSLETLDKGDSEKRFNDSQLIPEVYTRIGTTAAAINGLTPLDNNSRIIPLSVRNRNNQNVTLHFDLDKFNPIYSIYLEDKLNGQWSNLRETNAYTYTPAVMGDVHDRFVIHISYVPTSVVNPEENATTANGITITGIRGKAVVKIDSQMLNTDDGLIEVYSLEGQKVSETITAASETLISLPRVDAMFVVKVTAGGTTKTERVLGKY